MSEFRKSLRDEIISTQEGRAQFVHRKLTFVTLTLGIGALYRVSDNLPTGRLALFAPFLASVFDLYIAGADYGIKRAGAFLGRPHQSDKHAEEIQWQQRAEDYRDPFTKVAGPLLSLLVLIGAILVVWDSYSSEAYFWPWVGAGLLLNAFVWTASHRLNKRVRKFKEELKESPAHEVTGR